MRRWLVISLLLGALSAILIGSLTTAWWSHESSAFSASVGLRESRICAAEGCRTSSLGQGRHAERWVRSGTATWAVGLFTAGLMALLGVFVALGRARELLAQTALVASVSALLSGVLFVWMAPGYADMGAGYSMYTFFAGAVLGVIATGAALRAHDRERATS